MNVLLVSSHAMPHVGGVEILVDKEIRALTEAGHRVVLVTSDLGGNGETPLYPDTVRIVRAPVWTGLTRRLGLFGPIFTPRLLTILWRETKKCDVVHAHCFLAVNSVLALLLGHLSGRRCILTEHNGIQQRHQWTAALLSRLALETMSRLAVRAAHRCVAYNSRILRVLRRFAGPHGDFLFLPYPVDYERFRPPTPEQRQEARRRFGWPDDRPKVLFVGRLIAEKGIPLLLAAADASFDLVFCGAGNTSLLGALPRPGIEYLPPRPQRELVSIYHAADVLVLPSYVEGFPLVAREALACGLRVILAYDEGYEPYRRLPGLSFCERNPEAVKLAIVEALHSPTRTVSDERDPELCPEPAEWVHRLYDLSSLTTASR